MNIDLKGRTAIITGSTAGIGLATAGGLAHAGARVVVNGRSQERIDAAVQHIKDAVPGANASGIAADLSTTEGANAFLQQAGEADILVNNLGTLLFRTFAETSDDDWLSIFQVNVLSGIRMARYFLPRMIDKGWGRIVFISSESALNIPADMLDYGVTKTAQLAVSRGLAQLAAGTGVTVNTVLPGPTRSELVGNFLAQQAKQNGISQDAAEQAFLKANKPTHLLGRLTTPEEIANMIVYACSDQSSATTGAALRVDGGTVQYIV